MTGSVKRQWYVWPTTAILRFSVVISSEPHGLCGSNKLLYKWCDVPFHWEKGNFDPHSSHVFLEIRPTWSFSSVFHWPQNTWPWMTLNGHFTLNSVSTPACWAWEIVAFEVKCRWNACKLIKIGSYQRRECSAGSLVSGNVSLCGYSSGFSGEEGQKRQCGVVR